MVLSPATPDHAPAIAALIRPLAQDFLVTPDNPAAGPFWASVDEAAEHGYIASPRYAYTVAMQAGRLVGAAATVPAMSWLTPRLADLLPHAEPALVARLVALARPLQRDKGQPLLAAGERWQHLFLLERGALRLYYLDRHGAEWNKNFVFEGQPLWPVTHALRERPVDFFIAALEPARLHALPLDALDRLLADAPDWQALRLQALQQLLDEKLWREHLFLQCDAAARYQALRNARPAWCERIPLRHQASWLGITDVSLSRLRAAAAPPVRA